MGENVVLRLLAKNAGVNAVDNLGNTPLHMAAGMMGPSRTDVALILLDAGADIDMVNDAGYTPYCAAVDMGSAQMADLLKERGGERRTFRASSVRGSTASAANDHLASSAARVSGSTASARGTSGTFTFGNASISSTNNDHQIFAQRHEAE